MTLNCQKSDFLLIGNQLNKMLNISDASIRIGEVTISASQSAKYLGITFDNKLQSKLHVDNIVKQISCQLDVLRKYGHHMPRSARYTFYKAAILPDLDY